jgi:hypothetical protein
MMTIEKLISESHRIAKEHGWEGTSIGDQFSNFHSEISEAWEEYRKNCGMNEIYWSVDKYGKNKPEGIPIELADILIRIADTCGRYGINLEKAIEIKMEYNEGRPFRHGGKIA